MSFGCSRPVDVTLTIVTGSSRLESSETRSGVASLAIGSAAVVVGVGTLTVVLVVLPAWLAPRSSFDHVADAVRAQNDVRSVLLHSSLVWAWVPGARMEGADLTETDLRHAHLAGCCLDGAELVGAHLEDANPQGASLSGADLMGGKSVRSRCRSVHDMAGFDPEQAGVTYVA
ncbi:MAG: pentapeptide repeat-containing protein [Actinomadura sp.]